MSLNKRFATCIVTLFVLLSIFLGPLSDTTRAEDEYFDTDYILDLINLGKQLVDFDNILDPHPFRFISVWNSNDTMTINGDITFDLYFSSTILTQIAFLDFRDSINISVHHDDGTGIVEKVENANVNMVLEPSPSTEFLQAYHVVLSNVTLELEEDDSLIFTIEIIQSEKPLNDFVEKRFDTKIKNRVNRIVNLMKKTGNPDLENLSIIIEDTLDNISDLGIGGDEFGALINILVSSAFYYGSTTHPATVKFSTEVGDNYTLYFHNEPDYSIETAFSEFGYIKTMNGTAPSVDHISAYPPIALNKDMFNVSEIIDKVRDIIDENVSGMEDDEWITWLAIWALYVFEGPTDMENRVVYYLHSGGEMNSAKPNSSDEQRDKLSESTLSWSGDSFNINKILKNVTADLYIYHPKLLSFKKTVINVELKQGNKTLASSEQELDRTTLLEKIKRGADTPTRFYFEDLNDPEIWYNQDLTLEISVASAPFSIFKSPMISYDSSKYDSKITLTYEDTDNLNLSGLKDKEIYAGEKIEYTINVESKHSDTIDVTLVEIDSIGDWSYTATPSTVQVQAGETKQITLSIESKATDADAYDNQDFIQLGINLSGNTGFYSDSTNVSVTESAVEYDIEITPPEDVKIKHGSEGTFTFEIKNRNKGYMADRYTFNITSENGWELTYTEYIADYLEVSESAKVNVTLFVPWYTDIKTEEITFEITSYESEKYETFTKTITTNITIGEPNAFENIYQLFENAAKTIGLDNISEQYAGWILIILLIIVLVLIMLVCILLVIRKFIELVCTERIKEINTDETAVYDITIKNPYKSVLTYQIMMETKEENSKRWDVTTDTTQLMIEPKKERNIKINVKPTDYVKKGDWIEVKVIVKPIEKNKKAEISTVTSIKNAKVDVKMSGVFHWPRVFKKDDRVETSFKLFNRGNTSAENLSIILYVNGEEKNKVENITIPRGGHADINIPWIAVKGKNEVYIVVK